jgi:hypothetical protein
MGPIHFNHIDINMNVKNTQIRPRIRKILDVMPRFPTTTMLLDRGTKPEKPKITSFIQYSFWTCASPKPMTWLAILAHVMCALWQPSKLHIWDPHLSLSLIHIGAWCKYLVAFWHVKIQTFLTRIIKRDKT